MKKIVLLASSMFSMCLIQADGTPDSAFGGGFGYVSLPEGFYARGFALQDDGKIAVAGSNKVNKFEVVRYNNDGSLDLTFNGTGIGATGPDGVPFSLVVHPDGSIILVGQDATGSNFQLAKYTSEGILDTSFGASGVVTGPTGFAVDSVLQIDGKVIAAGNDNSGNFLVVRYDTDGSVDTTFTSGPLGYAESIKIQHDDKVLVAGTDDSGNMQIVRYNSNGTLDGSFGSGGVVTGPAGVATSLVIQPDGYYVVGGYELGSSPSMLLARYNIWGSLDSSFGSSGIVTGQQDFLINGITLQADGSIVAAGYGASDIKLTRYDASGTLDISFGINGEATGVLGDVFNVGLQWDGYIVTLGTDFLSNNFQVARFTSSPTLEPATFTSDTTQALGTVTISGTAQNPSQIFLYLDGEPLDSFYTDAGGANTWTTTTSITFEGLYTLRAVAIYKDGNSLVATGDVLRIY